LYILIALLGLNSFLIDDPGRAGAGQRRGYDGAALQACSPVELSVFRHEMLRMWELRKIMSVMQFKTASQQAIVSVVYLRDISVILHNANRLLEILLARVRAHAQAWVESGSCWRVTRVSGQKKRKGVDASRVMRQRPVHALV